LGEFRYDEPVEVELPAAFAEHERHGGHVRAENLRDLEQVRPQRHHFHHALARIYEELRGEHQGVHARRSCGNPIDPDRAMQARDVRGQRFAQLRDAEVVRIEHFARGDGVGARLPDELRRRLVGLANPERQHVGAADALVVQLADLGRGKRAHRRARR
jgi:hypothetical protein